MCAREGRNKSRNCCFELLNWKGAKQNAALKTFDGLLITGKAPQTQ
jgi:hypothetical protein